MRVLHLGEGNTNIFIIFSLREKVLKRHVITQVCCPCKKMRIFRKPFKILLTHERSNMFQIYHALTLVYRQTTSVAYDKNILVFVNLPGLQKMNMQYITDHKSGLK